MPLEHFHVHMCFVLFLPDFCIPLHIIINITGGLVAINRSSIHTEENQESTRYSKIVDLGINVYIIIGQTEGYKVHFFFAFNDCTL